MDIDTHREHNPEKERKRKHKNRDDPSTSKKKRKHESSMIADESAATTPKADKKNSKKSKSKEKSSKKHHDASTAAAPSATSPYVLTTATMYLPLSPISISPTHALASLCAEHLSPLLLTYYAPLQGIVLAYSNTSIASSPPSSSTPSEPADPSPQPLTLATTAGEYGVLYVYLTATFLVFRPQRGQILEGWVNVQSEGFLGAVVLNLFSVGIERKRLPSNWKWVPPGEEQEEGEDSSNAEKQTNKPAATTSEDEDSEPTASFDAEKEHFNPVTLASDANPLADTMMTEEGGDAAGAGADDDAAAEGYFQSVSGHRVRGTVRFRVVDIDIIPGSERDHGFMSIEGTMLTPEEEAKVLEDERNGILSTRSSSSMTPGRGASTPSMTGAITAVEFNAEPETPSKEAKPVKEKKSKSKKKDKER